MSLEERAKALVDDRLIQCFWDAANHLGTTDLVVYFDTEVEVDPVSVFVREALLKGPNAPPELVSKISKPARDAGITLKGTQTAFWLVASFPENMYVVAVLAKRLGQGGAA